MAMFRAPDQLFVHKAARWVTNRRMNAALGCYFRVGSKMDTNATNLL